MAEGSITYAQWRQLSEKERGERVKDLSDADRFRVRISMPPGFASVPCNDCLYYQGCAKCLAFPEGIPGEHMDAVEKNQDVLCAKDIRYQPMSPEALAERRKRWNEEGEKRWKKEKEKGSNDGK